MKQEIFTFVLLAAILSIGMSTVAYGVNSSEDTDPETPGHKQLSPKSFGSKTNICGLSFCVESLSLTDTLTVEVTHGII